MTQSQVSPDPERLRNVAVVLAGGVGARLGLGIPKQLIRIAGRSIVEHTIAAFQQHPDVDDVLVLMAPGHLDAVREILRSGSYPKVVDVVEGGETRSATTLAALSWLGDQECNVLLHDAVRPMVSQRIIGDCFDALRTHRAVDVAISSADSIIEVDEHNTIAAVPQRSSLRRGQTPQAFRASVLREAYARAAEDPGFEPADDCSVLLRYLPEEPIWVVPGDEVNMKVVEPIDLYLADKLFQMSADAPGPSTEASYRAALEGRTVVVFGGSYGIGADIAELARSYGADVHSFSRSSTGTHVERRADVAAAARQVAAASGRVDFVVNTAGVITQGPLVGTADELLRESTEINYLAPVFVAQEFHALLTQSRGALLLFTSSSYTRGRAGYSLYSSAKAAVVNLTQALSDDWASSGVRVNCVNPERTATPMRTKAFGVEPLDTLLDSKEVARTSLDVLISEQTGLVVDVRRADPFAAAEPS